MEMQKNVKMKVKNIFPNFILHKLPSLILGEPNFRSLSVCVSLSVWGVGWIDRNILKDKYGILLCVLNLTR